MTERPPLKVSSKTVYKARPKLPYRTLISFRVSRSCCSSKMKSCSDWQIMIVKPSSISLTSPITKGKKVKLQDSY